MACQGYDGLKFIVPRKAICISLSFCEKNCGVYFHNRNIFVACEVQIVVNSQKLQSK